MASAWTGQIAPLIKSGLPLAMTYRQAMLDADCYVVHKGSSQTELAMQFSGELSKAKHQAAFSSILPYGAANRSAYAGDLILPDIAPTLPSAQDYPSLPFHPDSTWSREHAMKDN